MNKNIKTYVTVKASFLPDGKLLPFEIVWEDGRRFLIDKILDIRAAASTKAGGCGIRYVCRISGSVTNLFFDTNRWFVERK